MTLTELEAQRDSLGRARAAIHWVRCKLLSASTGDNPIDLFRGSLPPHLKAAIPAHTTSAADIANNFMDAFTQLVRGRTLLGRLPYMPVPPFVPTPFVSTTGSAAFVPQGQPIPAVLFDRNLFTLNPTKIAILAAITRELLKSSDDRAITVLERLLVRLVVAGEDAALLSDTAAVDGGNPAGLLAGISASGAGSPTNADDDLLALFDAVSDGDPVRPVFVTSARGALYLRSLADDDHGSLFRDAQLTDGGSIAGVDLLISRAAGARLILIDAGLLGVSDEGTKIDTSGSAAVQLSDAPTNGAASMVSAFQTNSQIVRVVRLVDWKLATPDAIGYIDLPIGSPS